MKYARILMAAATELWAMDEMKLAVIIDFLAMQAAGGKLDAAEIEARIGKGREETVARQQGGVGILPLRGVIANRINMTGNISGGGGTSCEQFSAMLQAALRDDQVKAIVLDVDSPGGTVSGTDELSAQIFNARGQKPIVAHVNATAASAAYWIASAADEVVVTPSGAVGSVGVFSVHEDISAALEKAGIKRTLISAGEHKGEGVNFMPLADDTKAHVQQLVDEANSVFIKTLARNRNVSQAAVRDNFGKGRLVSAAAAVDRGMADSVGTLEDTLQRFGASLYGIPAASRKATSAYAPERMKRALALREAR
jgi:signal peptide peptidase SppA